MPDFCYIYKQLTLFDSMLKHRATIKDIARELNISPSTVSRALADRWDVNPETRRAVLEVAERLHYHPNPISLSLKQRQTMSIGVIVPEFFNSFFAEVITGIQEVMEPQGYHILISQSNEIAATELKNLLAMDAKMVDTGFGKRRFPDTITGKTRSARLFQSALSGGRGSSCYI